MRGFFFPPSNTYDNNANARNGAIYDYLKLRTHTPAQWPTGRRRTFAGLAVGKQTIRMSWHKKMLVVCVGELKRSQLALVPDADAMNNSRIK